VTDYDVMFKLDDDNFVRVDVFLEQLRSLVVVNADSDLGLDHIYWGRPKQ
jgi:hypothetical protein